MKEILKEFIKNNPSFEQKRDRTCEFLQHLILSIMDKRNQFSSLAFVGGTCLRVIYDLKRFSEDLDFSAIKESNKKLSLSDAVKRWVVDLTAWGFDVEVGGLRTGRLERCFIKFPGLLKELFISQDPRIKLSIRAEIDQNTPAGYKLETSVVQKNMLFSLTHHDLPSLFAGKLHAVLFRPFVKGRDLYDLLWYCTKKVPVNLRFLENAAKQTEGNKVSIPTTNDLQRMLTEKLSKISFSNVRRDLEPFLDDPTEIRFITKEHLLKTVKNIS